MYRRTDIPQAAPPSYAEALEMQSEVEDSKAENADNASLGEAADEEFSNEVDLNQIEFADGSEDGAGDDTKGALGGNLNDEEEKEDEGKDDVTSNDSDDSEPGESTQLSSNGCQEVDGVDDDEQRPESQPRTRASLVLETDLDAAMEEELESLPVTPAAIEQFEVSYADAESGRRERESHPKWAFWRQFSSGKRLILLFSVLFAVFAVLLVAIVPSCFVYIDYYEMGFTRNHLTLKTDYDRVYDYGCHFVAPTHETVLFPSTAQFVRLPLSVFTKESVTVEIDIRFQYFLRPSELAELYRKYHNGYDSIVRVVAEGALKNKFVSLSIEELRLNRSRVEREVFKEVKFVLSGDCCNPNAYERFHPTAKTPEVCNSADNCLRGIHVDVGFLQMAAITIPSRILNRYFKQVLLEMDLERTLYVQERAVEDKLTALSVQKILNDAKEIKAMAEAESKKIKMVSESDRLARLEESLASAVKASFGRLNIVQEEAKLSWLYMKTLVDTRDNLYSFTYNYNKTTSYAP